MPNIVWVDDNYTSGSCDGHAWGYDAFAKIQAGINAVAATGTVNVAAGNYPETVAIGKPLTLSGPNAAINPNTGTRGEEAVIDGTSLGASDAISVAANNVTIRGFEIAQRTGRAVYCEGVGGVGYWVRLRIENNSIHHVSANALHVVRTYGGVTIAGNRIADLTGPAGVDGSGIYFYYDSDPYGYGNLISGNVITNTTYGGILLNGTKVTITGNTLDTMPQQGIQVAGNSNPVTITGNTITGANALNTLDKGGIRIKVPTLTSPILIENNSINGCFNGIAATSDSTGLVNVTARNNNLAGNSNAGISNSSTNPANIINGSGNWWGSADQAAIDALTIGAVDFTPYLDSATDVGGDPADGFQGDFATLHVSTLGSQAGTSGRIQEGIDAVSGSTVLIEAGGYSENISLTEKVVLDGAGSGNTAADTIITSAAGNTPVIRITAGGANAGDRLVVRDLRVTGATGGENPGAGILVEGGAAVGFLTFQNVTSTGNQGAGIAFNNTAGVSDVAITGSSLSNNGFGLRIATAVPSFDGLAVSGCELSHNLSSAFTYNPSGNLANTGTNFSFTDCSFADNSRAGVANQHDLSFFGFHGNATLTNVTVNSGNGSAANSNSHGIAFTNQSTFAPAGTITLQGVTCTGHVGKGAMTFQYYNDVSGIQMTDVDVSGVVAPWGQVVSHHSGSASLDLGNTVLKTLVLWYSGDVDATGAVFKDLATGAVLDKNSLAGNLAIETQVYHKFDNAALGLVTWQTGWSSSNIVINDLQHFDTLHFLSGMNVTVTRSGTLDVDVLTLDGGASLVVNGGSLILGDGSVISGNFTSSTASARGISMATPPSPSANRSRSSPTSTWRRARPSPSTAAAN